MKTTKLTRKQARITARQEKLTSLVPNAISCDFIASVNPQLPNGYTVKSITINHESGHKWHMLTYKEGKEKIYTPDGSMNIQGVEVDYILIKD